MGGFGLERGGLVVIADRGVQAELPLPVAGLLSDAPLAEVVEASRACVAAAEAVGCKISAPFQILSFLALVPTRPARGN